MRPTSIFVLLAALAAVSTALPTGFLREMKYEAPPNFPYITRTRFLPDGRMMFSTKDGKFYVADPSQTPIVPVLVMTLPNVDNANEKGLFSFQIDPNFSLNGFFYAWYVASNALSTKPPGLTLSRFKFTDPNPQSTETVFWRDTDGNAAPYHYGGDVDILNGQIFATQGDKTNADQAMDMTKTATCIIRINLDGSIPLDNNTPKNDKACFAWGIRNGWRMMADAQTNKLFIGEVGGNDQTVASEDIHLLDLSKSGKNFGWPSCEGFCNNPDFVSTCNCQTFDNPIYAYTHKDSTAPTGVNAAVMGGAIYRGTQFPTTYRGAYFFADYSRNWLKYMPMKADGSGSSAAPVTFDTATFGCIGMSFSPDGSLWLNSIYGLERIFTVGGNQPPVISKATGTPQAGPTPLVVSFQGLATDPEGSAVTYAWDFGDGTTSTQQNPTKTYNIQGTYSVFLRVSDGATTSTSAMIKIEAGNKPIVTISSPVASSFFVAGQTLNLVGSAVQNGVAVTSPAAFAWNILLFHDDHTHPVASNVVGLSTTLPVPSSGHSFEDNVFFIITLTVTSNNLQGSAQINVYPTKSYGQITAQPSNIGLVVTVDGIPHTPPFISDQLRGFTNTFAAPTTHCFQNRNFNFASWSDGLAASHSITAPVANYTLKVTYVESGTCVSGPSCFTYSSCGVYVPGNLCQCDSQCGTFGNCCPDLDSFCNAPVTTTTKPVITTTTAKPITTTTAPVITTTTIKPITTTTAPITTTTIKPITTTTAPIITTTTKPVITTTTTTKPVITTTAAPNSCAKFKSCTGYVPGQACQCDPSCATFNNCCSDRTAYCSQASNTCAFFGCGSFVPGRTCQCDKACSTFGNCCSDITTCP